MRSPIIAGKLLYCTEIVKENGIGVFWGGESGYLEQVVLDGVVVFVVEGGVFERRIWGFDCGSTVATA